MPRANRYFVPGYLWHITHRCHEQDFLLKFAKDRKRWRYWLFEARKRHGLCVLNYIVTSNHIHLIVKDTADAVIPKSLQLIAGRTAQEYNKRKNRKGAFWEDRYHATAIESGEHLARCLVYIDLNMVRANVISHPSEWADSGYQDIQYPCKRYRIIDLRELAKLFNCDSVPDFQQQHRRWVEEALSGEINARDSRWSEGLAIGSEEYVDSLKKRLSPRSRYRHKYKANSAFVLRDEYVCYRADSAAKNSSKPFSKLIIR
jgi:putative transposase